MGLERTRVPTRGVLAGSGSADEPGVSTSLITPFRLHYENCRALDLDGQVQACADHLQHPEVLLMEFFESYHQIEGRWDPAQPLRPPESDELILEPFYESLVLEIDRAPDDPQRLVCVSGSLSPIPDKEHPAISRRGVDYVAVHEGPVQRVVLGVTQASEKDTPYLLLLRALNCFAELSPPLRVAQLGTELLGRPLSEDLRIDLHVGMTETDAAAGWASLVELSRDLAELFIRQVAEYPQFAGTLGRVALLEIEAPGSTEAVAMRPVWEV